MGNKFSFVDFDKMLGFNAKACRSVFPKRNTICIVDSVVAGSVTFRSSIFAILKRWKSRILSLVRSGIWWVSAALKVRSIWFFVTQERTRRPLNVSENCFTIWKHYCLYWEYSSSEFTCWWQVLCTCIMSDDCSSLCCLIWACRVSLRFSKEQRFCCFSFTIRFRYLLCHRGCWRCTAATLIDALPPNSLAGSVVECVRWR